VTADPFASVVGPDPFASALAPQPPPGAPTLVNRPTPPDSIAAAPQGLPRMVGGLSPMPNAPPVPPPSAEQRKNQKTDTKRRQGTALRHVTGVANPPSPPNSTTDPVPQMAAPPPAVTEAPVTYNAPKYKPPSKGIEYVLTGLGLLFPGAPIARFAAGALQGMNTGAQQGYERNEQAAKDQYEVAREKARTDAANASAQRQAQLDAQAVAFQNARTTYELQTLPQRQNGIDPKTGKPFILPPQLVAPLPPHASAAQRYQRENALAAFYQTVGASNLVAEHDTAAKGYAEDARAEATSAAALQRTMMTITAANQRFVLGQQGENARAEARIGAEFAIHNDSEYQENYRFAIAQRNKLRSDTVAQGQLASKASAADGKFQADFRKLTAEPTYKLDTSGNKVLDSNGQPIITKAAPISNPAQVKQLAQAFKAIERSQDPIGMANWISTKLGDQTDPSISAMQQLLSEKANAANLSRLQAGQLVVHLPQSYFDHLDKVNAQMTQQAIAHGLRAMGLNPSDPQVQAGIAKAQSLGLDVTDPHVLQTLKGDLAPKPKPFESIAPEYTPGSG
jgi:hypothetical protein